MRFIYLVIIFCMKQSLLQLFILSFLFCACGQDKKEAKSVNNETPFEQTPQMKKLEVKVEIPEETGWSLDREFVIDDFEPIGVAYHNNDLYLSDTIQKIVLRASLVEDKVDTIAFDISVPFLNKRTAKVILPARNRDSIFVYRGSLELYKFKIKEKLNRPTYFEGFKVKDNYIVDNANHRVVHNMGDTVSVFGKQGTGDEDFLFPSCAKIVSNKIFISDTGNGRIKAYNLDVEFLKNFNGDGKITKPTAMATDGNNLFVLDSDTNKVHLFTTSGALVYTLPIELEQATDIYFEADRLYVSDTGAGVIKIFTNSFYTSK